MAQQQWEKEQRLRVEATRIEAQTSPVECRGPRNGVRLFCPDGRVKQNPNVGLHKQSWREQKHIFAQEGVKKNASYTLVSNLASKLHTQRLNYPTPSVNFEAIEVDLQRQFILCPNGVLELRRPQERVRISCSS